MARSKKKGLFFPEFFYRLACLTDRYIKLFNRAPFIPFIFTKFAFSVYNGKKFIQVPLTDYTLLHRLGEFSLTRSPHIAKKKKKQLKRKKQNKQNVSTKKK